MERKHRTAAADTYVRGSTWWSESMADLGSERRVPGKRATRMVLVAMTASYSFRQASVSLFLYIQLPAQDVELRLSLVKLGPEPVCFHDAPFQLAQHVFEAALDAVPSWRRY